MTKFSLKSMKISWLGEFLQWNQMQDGVQRQIAVLPLLPQDVPRARNYDANDLVAILISVITAKLGGILIRPVMQLELNAHNITNEVHL